MHDKLSYRDSLHRKPTSVQYTDSNTTRTIAMTTPHIIKTTDTMKSKTNPSRVQRVSRKIEFYYDKIRGLDFSLIIQPEDLGLDESLVFRGSPSGNIFLTNVLRDLKITEADSILDIGCAKGSALRCMLDFRFKKVDGVEISQELGEIANTNFKKLKKINVDIYNVDARYFNRYGDYNFFYLYNPFPEIVMADVIKSLSRQVSTSDESIIIYNNPTCHHLVESHGFRKIREYPDIWGNGIYVYTNGS